MTSSPGLRGWSRLQARRGVLQTTTDDDDRRRQTPESKTILAPYTKCRRASKAPTTPATMSKQQATLSKQRSTLSKQHSTLLPQTATMSNDSIVKFRPFDNVETNWTCSICFDVVERTKFRSTLLPKPATLLPKTATMSKQHSTLSKESFNL